MFLYYFVQHCSGLYTVQGYTKRSTQLKFVQGRMGFNHSFSCRPCLETFKCTAYSTAVGCGWWISSDTCFWLHPCNFFLNKQPKVDSFAMIAQIEYVVCCQTQEDGCWKVGRFHHQLLFNSNEILCQDTSILIHKEYNMRLVVVFFHSFSRWGATLYEMRGKNYDKEWNTLLDHFCMSPGIFQQEIAHDVTSCSEYYIAYSLPPACKRGWHLFEEIWYILIPS